MKIAVTFTKKVPGPEEYSSLGYHLTIETEPPADVAQNRDKLASYCENLFAECRARVDDQVRLSSGQQADRVPEPTAAIPSSRSVPNGHVVRRPVPVRRPAGRNGMNGSPERNGYRNGHASGEDGGGDAPASAKQQNFIRSLATNAGYSANELAHLSREVVGKPDIRTLTKREASQMIDQLRADAG